MLIALSVPFTASLHTIFALWTSRCTAALTWTFAPLLLSCGEPIAAAQLFGWTLTALTLASTATAIILAVADTTLTRAHGRKGRLVLKPSFFAVSALLVGLATVAAILLTVDSSWGNGAWIFFGSGAGLLAYVITLVFRLGVRISRHRAP